MKTVKCSICENRMECPENMLNTEHICAVCTEVLSRDLTKEDANEIAKMESFIEKYKDYMTKLGMFIHSMSFGSMKMPKEQLKEIGKKELAETMHFDGVMATIDFFMHAGMPAEFLKDTLREIEKSRIYLKKDKNIKGFVRDVQNVIAYIGAVGEKLEKMNVPDEEFDRVMKSINPKSFEDLDENPEAEEGLVKIMNTIIFKDNWNKHLEWVEKYGTKNDVEIVKKAAAQTNE